MIKKQLESFNQFFKRKKETEDPHWIRVIILSVILAPVIWLFLVFLFSV